MNVLRVSRGSWMILRSDILLRYGIQWKECAQTLRHTYLSLNFNFIKKSMKLGKLTSWSPIFHTYTMVWKYLPLKIVKDLNEIRYVELAGKCLIKLFSFPCLPMPHPDLPPHRENTMENFLNDLQSYTCSDLCCSIVLTSWKFFYIFMVKKTNSASISFVGIMCQILQAK